MNKNSINLDYYGDNFQQKSKYYLGKLPKHNLDWEKKPEPYKVYKTALNNIKLPNPVFNKNIRFWDVIKNRKSTRNFNYTPITLNDLSVLLYGMNGITRITPYIAYRTAPSAGGLYPIEIYPIINNIESLAEGIYHYNISQHSIELLKQGDFRKSVAEGCLGQKMVFNSAVNFIFTAIIERSKWKYLQRCYRYIYMDCGHIGQNLYLTAEALGLGVCTIGAIFDDELNKLLEIDGKNETAIYVGVVGKND